MGPYFVNQRESFPLLIFRGDLESFLMSLPIISENHMFLHMVEEGWGKIIEQISEALRKGTAVMTQRKCRQKFTSMVNLNQKGVLLLPQKLSQGSIHA